jgi:hypothetical protein
LDSRAATSLRRPILTVFSLLAAGAFLFGLQWALGGGAAPSYAQTTTRYVAPSGSDASNICTASITPCQTIQHAVDVAHSGDEIRVATGVYTGVQVRAGITQVVYISTAVTMRGGFTTTNWVMAFPITQPTTLDAQGAGRVMVISGTITPTVEGLHITGGNASGLGGDPIGYDAGGGMYVYTAAATVSGCVVVSNTSSNSGAGRGGGVFISGSVATLQNNVITNNMASTGGSGQGGGLFLYDSATTLSGNMVVSNTASAADEGRGGWALSEPL